MPASGNTPYPGKFKEEQAADDDYAAVVVNAVGCTVAGAAGCGAVTRNLNALSDDALAAAVSLEACAQYGVDDKKTDLDSAQKKWYSDRASLWFGLKQALDTHAADVAAGTYRISAAFQANYLTSAPIATPSTKTYPKDCSRDTMPAEVAAAEKSIQGWPAASCTKPKDKAGCEAAAANMSKAVDKAGKMLRICASASDTASEYNQAWYIQETGNWEPLQLDLVEHSDQVADGTYRLPPGWGDAPHQAPPAIANSPYVRSLLGGTYSGASGVDPQGKLLADVFLDLPLHGVNSSGEPLIAPKDGKHESKLWLWGYTRLGSIGMAQSAVDPSQIAAQYAALSTSTPSQIVQSFEMNAGVAYQFKNFETNIDLFGRVSLSLIAGGGALTPLSPGQTQPETFMVTADVKAAYPATQACTVAAPTVTNCYLQLYTQDRSRFYRDYEAGLRIKLYPKPDPRHAVAFPALFDITMGQNEYVTGGKLHGTVLHVGGSTPIERTGLYIFGNMDIGINNKADFSGPLLIPVTANIAATDTVTRVAVASPNRDRYAVGVGIDLLQLLRGHQLADALTAVGK